MTLTAVAQAAAQATAKAARSTDDLTGLVFIDIAIIVVVARLAGSLFKKIRQPAVVGEILAGIALGPSLLGLFPGHLPDRIFPKDVRPFLNILAQVGLVIFMFIVGLELDVALIRGKERVAGVISLTSIAIPFALGILLAGALHSSHLAAPAAHRFVPFALFMGASMSITAFPVLARILTERRMYRTEIGALALACAAVDDIVAWSLLALVLAIVKSSGALSLPTILGESIAFVAFMFLVVKPGLERLARQYRRAGRLTPNIFAVIVVGFLSSAYLTQKIGIHQIFGAFIFGVVMPRKDTADFFHELVERLEQVSILALLPLYFIVTGFSVDIRGLGRDALTQLPLILLVAISGKLVGASAAARVQGIPGRKAAAIGVLMNTRGLTELIILNVGRELGVLDSRLFTMLVVMAVITTIMTEPALRLVYPDNMLRRDIEEAEKAALGVVDAYRVLALVGDDGGGEELVDTALAVIGDDRPSEVVLSSFSPSGTRPELGGGLFGELAQMATKLEQLKALARRVEQSEVSSVVRSQFSDNFGGDLITQAGMVSADVILAGAGSFPALGPDFEARLEEASGAQLAVIIEPEARRADDGTRYPVLVVTTEGANGAAVLELAVRLARSRHLALVLAPDSEARKAVRHATERAEELRRGGLEATVGTLGDGPRLEALARLGPVAAVVAGPDLGEAGLLANALHVSVIVVRARAGDDSRGLMRLLKRAEEPREP